MSRRAFLDRDVGLSYGARRTRERYIDAWLDEIEDEESCGRDPELKIDGFYAEKGSKRHKRIGGGKSYANAGIGRIEYRNGHFKAHAKGPNAYAYAKSTYIGYEAKAGVSAAKAGAQYTHQFEASVTGPYAEAEVHAKVTGVGFGLRAGAVKASARAGDLTVTAGCDIDTEARIGLDGVKVKVLGTGVSIGNNGIEGSVFGTGIALDNPGPPPMGMAAFATPMLMSNRGFGRSGFMF